MLENCVDVVPYNFKKTVVIKEPGSTRDSKNVPITKITCTGIEQARELAIQILERLKDEKE